MFRSVVGYFRRNVVGFLALFVALGGTAYAVNTVGSSDIIDGQVKSVDVGDNEIGSADVKDGSLNTFDVHSFIGEDVIDGTLTGADINEGSLATVPSSVLGGLGRFGLRQNGTTGPGSCNPESSTFINCDMAATLNLSRPARVLVIGSVRATTDADASDGIGECLLGTTSGPIIGTLVTVVVEDNPGGLIGTENLSISGVTGVFPAGQHSFGIDCNDSGGGTQYAAATVTAVALSDQ